MKRHDAAVTVVASKLPKKNETTPDEAEDLDMAHTSAEAETDETEVTPDEASARVRRSIGRRRWSL